MMDDPVARLGATLRHLRQRAGLTQDELSMAAGYGASRAVISRAENAGGGEDDPRGSLISRGMITKFDGILGAGGELVRLHNEASVWLKRRRATTRVAMDSSPRGDAPLDGGVMTGEDATDRRQLGIGVAASVFAVGLVERMAAADPTPFALGKISADVHRLPGLYGVIPDVELRAIVEPAWMGVERLLDDRVSRNVRDELGTNAGLYAYYLGGMAYKTGDDEAALAYLDIARRHASETGDPLLVGAVARMHAAQARRDGDYRAAADVAGHARTHGDVHPYTLGALACEEAGAAARLRDGERARRALAAVETNIWTGEILPGPDPCDEEAAHAEHAIVLAYLGEGEAAEGHARDSLELLQGSRKPYLAGGTYNSLALAFVRRRRPDPEQAAAAAARAIEVAPDRWVVESAARIARDLARWQDLPAVRDLGEQVVAARRVLPAPPRTALA